MAPTGCRSLVVDNKNASSIPPKASGRIVSSRTGTPTRAAISDNNNPRVTPAKIPADKGGVITTPSRTNPRLHTAASVISPA